MTSAAERSPEHLALLESLPWAARPVWRGIDCGDGWLPIIERLNEALHEIDPSYRVIQVKEKFGTLSYYVDGFAGDTWQPYAEAVRAAAAESARTCDTCGAAGELRNDRYWWRTLCDTCDETVPGRRRVMEPDCD